MKRYKTVYLDIRPLFQEKLTGVPNYCFEVVKLFISERYENLKFFSNYNEYPREVVESLVSNDTSVAELVQHLKLNEEPLDLVEAKESGLAIYFATKDYCDLFNIEVEVVHDLALILGDEWHDKSTTKQLVPLICSSIKSNDLNLTVSDSTNFHVKTYFDLPGSSVKTIGCGPRVQGDFIDIKDNVRPYFLILGTIEPRKNQNIVLQTIRKYPELLNTHQFVFVGAYGWGKTFKQQVAANDLGDCLDNGSIVYLEYVDEVKKLTLLHHATALIYSSFFEGFGMPVLESLVAKTPVICSKSTSLPEVGGKAALYFNPHSTDELRESLLKSTHLKDNDRFLQEAMVQSKKYTWENVYKKMLSAISSNFKRV